MPRKQLVKTAALVAFLCLSVWRVIGYPNFMNAYAVDPRSKPELRQSCAVCHAPEGRKTDANFLTEFGREFKANDNRITPAMRDRFIDLFFPSDRPISDVPTDTVKFSTEQVVVNVTVLDRSRASCSCYPDWRRGLCCNNRPE